MLDQFIGGTSQVLSLPGSALLPLTQTSLIQTQIRLDGMNVQYMSTRRRIRLCNTSLRPPLAAPNHACCCLGYRNLLPSYRPAQCLAPAPPRLGKRLSPARPRPTGRRRHHSPTSRSSGLSTHPAKRANCLRLSGRGSPLSMRHAMGHLQR